MADASEPTDGGTAADVTVRVPGLLTRYTEGRNPVTVSGTTVADCVEALLERYPALDPHLLDGAGDLRPHVTLFHDGSAVEGLANADVAVATGDEIVVLQAVSGG